MTFTEKAFEDMMESMSLDIKRVLDQHETSNSTSMFDVVSAMALAMLSEGKDLDEIATAIRFFAVGWAAGKRFGGAHESG